MVSIQPGIARFVVTLFAAVAIFPYLIPQQATVVNNPAPNSRSFTFRVAAQPTMKVGGLNDDERLELLGVVDAVFSPTGELIVAPSMVRPTTCSQEIRVFDANGRFVRRFGRGGQGPGEYDCISRIAAIGRDTIMIMDRDSRMTMTDIRGNVLATRSLNEPGTRLCCFRDASWLTSPHNLSAFIGGRGQNRPPITFTNHRATGDTAGMKSVTVPVGDTALRIRMGRGGGGWWSPPTPYARTAHLALTADEIVYGVGDSYEYQVFSKDGRLLRTVRAALPAAQVTRAHIDEWRTDLEKVAVVMESTGEFKAVSAAMRFPATLPAFSDIRAEENGTVWIRSYGGRTAAPADYWWARFNRQGTLLGTLKLPPDRSLIRFQGDRVLLRARDTTSGAVSLLVHRIERIGG